jgi:hypothetical protein
LAIVAPVTKPTSASAGSPSRSSSQPAAACSTAVVPGVAKRIAVFWSQLLTSQSAPSAAGSVPPMTQPKNRPDGIAIRPGSTSPASRSTTFAGSVGPSGNGSASSAASSSAVTRGGIGRSGSEASHERACRAAADRAAS